MQEKKVAKSFLASQMTLMSVLVVVKMIGFVKQIVLAAVYGTSFGVDVYYLTSGFVGGIAQMIFTAIGVVVLPLYTNKVVNQGRRAGNSYMSKIIKISVAIAILLTIGICLFSKQLAYVVAPTYSYENILIVSKYLKIFTIAIIFYCFSNLFGVILDVEKVFIPYRVSGLINSITFVVITLIFEKKFGEDSLVVAALVSWIFQLLNIYFFSRKYFKYTNNYKIKDIFHDSEIGELIRLLVPILLGNAIIEINDIVDKSISTGLTVGALSALSYAQILKEFVVFIFITSLGGVLYSYISKYIAQKKEKLVSQFLNKILRVLVMILLPISIYVFLYAVDISAVVYMRGNFKMDAVKQCAMALRGYSLGFCFIAVRECINKTHYAYRDTKNPLKNGIIAVCGNIVCTIILSKILGIAGVSIATSISACISCILTLFTIKKHNKAIKLFSNKKSFIQIIVSGTFSIASYLLFFNITENNIENILIGSFVIFVPYLLVLFILRNEEFTYFINIVKQKFVRG